MDKKTLQQYMDLKIEREQVKIKIIKLENELMRLRDETVQDKVKGGIGGWQSFTIEGFPSRDYGKKKQMLIQRAYALQKLQNRIDTMVIEIENFIASVDDSHMRRIIDLRVIQGMEWHDVAKLIGGGNTEDTVRMQFNRFMEKQEKKKKVS